MFDLVWLGLWHINHVTLFNAKSFVHVYIKFMFSKHSLRMTFINKPELIIFFFYTVKWFHLFL